MDKNKSNISAIKTRSKYPVGGHRSLAPIGTEEYYLKLKNHRYNYETPFILDTFHFKDLGNKEVLEIGVGNGIDAVEMMRNGAIYYEIGRAHV